MPNPPEVIGKQTLSHLTRWNLGFSFKPFQRKSRKIFSIQFATHARIWKWDSPNIIDQDFGKILGVKFYILYILSFRGNQVWGFIDDKKAIMWNLRIRMRGDIGDDLEMVTI